MVECPTDLMAQNARELPILNTGLNIQEFV
jgi:hypothetical protein